LISPNQFIPLGRETGLIVPIGRWVLENACEQGVRLNTRFGRSEPLAISVNLSVRQLRSDAIVSDVRCALEKSGFPAESLVLEITETVVMADTEFAVQRLRRAEIARRSPRHGRLRHGLLVAQFPSAASRSTS